MDKKKAEPGKATRLVKDLLKDNPKAEADWLIDEVRKRTGVKISKTTLYNIRSSWRRDMAMGEVFAAATPDPTAVPLVTPPAPVPVPPAPVSPARAGESNLIPAVLGLYRETRKLIHQAAEDLPLEVVLRVVRGACLG